MQKIIQSVAGVVIAALLIFIASRTVTHETAIGVHDTRISMLSKSYEKHLDIGREDARLNRTALKEIQVSLSKLHAGQHVH